MGKQLLDSNFQPTTLKKGDIIVFRDEHHYLTLSEGDGSRIFWPNGDDKRIANFLRNEEDFIFFALILAETHGLLIEKIPDCVGGPRCEFI